MRVTQSPVLQLENINSSNFPKIHTKSNWSSLIMCQISVNMFCRRILSNIQICYFSILINLPCENWATLMNKNTLVMFFFRLIVLLLSRVQEECHIACHSLKRLQLQNSLTVLLMAVVTTANVPTTVV